MKKLLPLALAAVAGCGSLADLPGCDLAGLPGPSPHVFGGVRGDWKILSGQGGCKSRVFVPCAFLDLPLSAAMDVVLLPLTVPPALWRPSTP